MKMKLLKIGIALFIAGFYIYVSNNQYRCNPYTGVSIVTHYDVTVGFSCLILILILWFVCDTIASFVRGIKQKTKKGEK